MDKQLEILIVDDNATVRQALALILDAEADLTVVGEAKNIDEALALVAAHGPAIALIDISLKGGDGLDLVRKVRVRAPSMKTIVFSLHDESLYIDAAREAGADGYVMKTEEPRVIIQTIRKVAAGQTRFPEPDPR